MLARAILAAAVSASVAAAYSIPSCWEACFQKYDINNENCLCSAPLEKVITSCISQGCPANNATSSAGAYGAWLSAYCGEQGTTTTYQVTTQYTTVCPVTASSPGWNSPSVYTTTSAVLTSYQTTAVVTPTSYTPVTSAVSTSSLSSGTWVSTSYQTTYTPGLNTWTGANSVPAYSSPVSPTTPATSPVSPTTPAVWTSATGASTGWNGAQPSATPAPYSGASSIQVGGLLGAVGAVIVALL